MSVKINIVNVKFLTESLILWDFENYKIFFNRLKWTCSKGVFLIV